MYHHVEHMNRVVIEWERGPATFFVEEPKMSELEMPVTAVPAPIIPNLANSRWPVITLALLLTLTSLQATAQDFQAIDQLLETNLHTAYDSNVVCLIEIDGAPVYSRSLGALDPDTPALIASATKNMSGALILALVDDGYLSLDDTIGAYLPIFSQHARGHLTIRQCFSHTSGLAESSYYIGDPTLTLATAVDSIAVNVPLTEEPGAFFRYGGTSMHIVGRIAEVATGKTWNTLFDERIAQRCGMTQTEYALHPGNPRIAGGIRSTPTDIMAFCRLILNVGVIAADTVLGAAYIEEMWTDQTHGAPQLSSPYPHQPEHNNPYYAETIYYGLGSWLDVYNPQTEYQEQISGAGAFCTIYWIDRVRGITGVVFTLSSYSRAYDTTFQIIDVVRRITDVVQAADRPDLASPTQVRISPNPFNPRTSIYFTLSRPRETSLVVYNTRGHRIATLVDRLVLAGEHQVTFDGSGYPSGVYVFELVAGDERRVLKSVLLK